jgi:thioredoxin-related protein
MFHECKRGEHGIWADWRKPHFHDYRPGAQRGKLAVQPALKNIACRPGSSYTSREPTNTPVKRLCLPLLLLTASVAFATPPGWLVSYDQARKFAAKTGTPILLDFTGSDWCGWCKKMQAETLSQKPFIAFASSNLILVEVDFPQQVPQTRALQQANEALKAKFSVSGFPTFVLVDAKGNELGRQVGYLEGGVPAFTGKLKEWMAKADAAKPPVAPSPAAAP